jgi:hypothetical protein
MARLRVVGMRKERIPQCAFQRSILLTDFDRRFDHGVDVA